MVELNFTKDEGTPRASTYVFYAPANRVAAAKQKFADDGWHFVEAVETEPGEIERDDLLAQLRDLLPKLKKLTEKTLPLVLLGFFVLRKMHLVRPDLIPFPFDVQVVC